MFHRRIARQTNRQRERRDGDAYHRRGNDRGAPSDTKRRTEAAPIPESRASKSKILRSNLRLNIRSCSALLRPRRAALDRTSLRSRLSAEADADLESSILRAYRSAR